MVRLFKLFKLDDEKFFFNLLAVGDVEEPVLSSTSVVERCPNGEPSGRVSVGLISRRGDGGRRKVDAVLLEGSVGSGGARALAADLGCGSSPVLGVGGVSLDV